MQNNLFVNEESIGNNYYNVRFVSYYCCDNKIWLSILTDYSKSPNYYFLLYYDTYKAFGSSHTFY